MTNAKNKNKRKGKYNATSRKLENRIQNEQKKKNKAIEKESTVVSIEMVAVDVDIIPKQNESVINAEKTPIILKSIDKKTMESNYTAPSESQSTATTQVAEVIKTEIDISSEAAIRATAITLKLLELFGHNS